MCGTTQAPHAKHKAAVSVVQTSPGYRVPFHLLALAGYFVLRGRPRCLGSDFRFLLPHMPKAPVVQGTEYLPTTGPLVIVGNHYQRPGLWMGWAAMVVGRAVFEHTNRDIRWVAISEWENYRILGIPVP